MFLYCRDLKQGIVSKMAILGRECSLFVYIYHLMVIKVLIRYVDISHTWLSWIVCTLIVYVLCITICMLFKRFSVTRYIMVIVEGKWIRK